MNTEVQKAAAEQVMVDRGASALSEQDLPGTPAFFTCPECHGPLLQIMDGNLVRFRCRVGHAFSLEAFEQEQKQELERSFWAMLVMLDERASLQQRMAKGAREREDNANAEQHEKTEAAARECIMTIRQMLAGIADM